MKTPEKAESPKKTPPRPLADVVAAATKGRKEKSKDKADSKAKESAKAISKEASHDKPKEKLKDKSKEKSKDKHKEKSKEKSAKAKASSASAGEVSPPRIKLVRDSFTMPGDEFEMIATLKARALEFKRPTKKSELLRAGLQQLAALDDTQLNAALAALRPLPTGRPKKPH